MHSRSKTWTSIVILIVGLSTFMKGQSIDTSQLIKNAEKQYYEGKDAYYSGDYFKARIIYDSSLQVYEQYLPEVHELRYKIYNRIHRNETRLRNYQRADEMGMQAIKMSLSVYGPRAEETAWIYNNMSLLKNKEFRLNESIELAEKAIDIIGELYGKESAEVAGYIMNNADNYSKKGDYNTAMQMYLFSEKLMEKELEGDDEEFNRIFLNMSILLRRMGNIDKALDYGEKALRIKLIHYREDHPSVGKYYDNLARLKAVKKEYEESDQLYEKALKMKGKGFGMNSLDVIGTYNDRALIYLDQGDYEKGKALLTKARELVQERSRVEDLGLVIESNLAGIAMDVGDYEEAIESYKKIAEYYVTQADGSPSRKAGIFLDLARAYRYINSSRDASDAIKEAEFYAKKILKPTEANRLMIRLIKEDAKILLADQDPTKAKEAFDKLENASELLINLRKRYIGSDAKAYLNEEIAELMDLSIHAAISIYENENDSESLSLVFENIEKAKAASFWDNESEVNAFNYGGAPTKAIEDIEAQRNLVSQLENKLSAQTKSSDLSGIKDALFNANKKLETQFANLEKEYPDYYDLKYALNPASMDDMQKSLSSNMALVNFYILDTICYSILVTNGKSTLVSSPISIDLQDNLEQKYFTEDEINSKHLYRDIFQSIDEQLNLWEITRVVLVPHKFLHYVSFDQLKSEVSGNLLVYDYAFSFQHRASDHIVRGKDKITYSYAGFAPLWDSNNPDQLVAEYRNELLPLPGSKKEIETSSKIWKGASFLDDLAKESEFKSSANKFDIIHLASHAIVDPENDNNSCLYFSEAQSDNEYGEEDGKLFMHEITNLDLGAQLIVLSACNTGAGRLTTGEGIMSFSRAFRYAGAESILMSLWLANDQSSIPIVSNFLSNIKRGLPKDVALQQSKIEYLENADPLMRDEFYWAGFLINGNLSPIKTGPSSLYNYLIPILLLFAAGFIINQQIKKGRMTEDGSVL